MTDNEIRYLQDEIRRLEDELREQTRVVSVIARHRHFDKKLQIISVHTSPDGTHVTVMP